MSREDIEELTVPSTMPDGKSPDTATKAGAKQSKAVRQNTAVQRIRLERLLLTDRSWSLADWKQRYQEQPLRSSMVERLVWRFETPDGASQLAMAANGGSVDVTGQRVDLDATVRVRLWHPIESDSADVRAWRRFLEDRRIVQPFKQAHREVYRATEADLRDPEGSDRFAGHVIRQDQFKALCDERNWRYHIQGRWVRGDGLATRELAEQDFRAELTVRPDTDGDDAVRRAFYPYLTTERVRFLYINGSTCPPQLVPAQAFSEIMRDVDLFVGVCSIGVDPAWNDRRDAGRHGSYWQEYAFGDLTEAAAIRKETLAGLLPTLSFASRCSLDGRFLIVQGDLATYKIHIGSGNVLMSPNDLFLNIPLPRRRVEPDAQVFMPFEGDTMLAQILSRAAVLAGDGHLSDRALRDQIVANSGSPLLG